MLTFFFYSFQYFSSMNTFILKKYIMWKNKLAPRSVEISAGPASKILVASEVKKNIAFI